MNFSEEVAPSSLADELEGLSARAASSGLSDGELVVRRLGVDSPFFAALTSDGDWALAVTVEPQAPQPPVRLQSFSAEFGVTYLLQDDESRARVRVCVLRCRSERRDIRELFLVVCNAVTRQVGLTATDTAVAKAIDGWLGLFQKLERPPRSTVTGLIGELVFMHSCGDVEAAVRAWHRDLTSTVDFVFTNPALEVEVKATTGARRAHEVGLSQVQHALHVRRYFASVLIDFRAAGVPVTELVTAITSKLALEDDVLSLWRGIVDTCGEQLDGFLSQRFLRDEAELSLRLYSADRIPQPRISFPIDVGVSDVRFRSDFSGSQMLAVSEVFPHAPDPG